MDKCQVREKQAEDVLDLVSAYQAKSDLVVVAGDLNATPKSAVYKKFINSGLVDTLVDDEERRGDLTQFMTWAHAANSWSAPEEVQCRIDYILYTHRKGLSVNTSAYHTVDAKTEKDGRMISLSDHMWVEANLRVTL